MVTSRCRNYALSKGFTRLGGHEIESPANLEGAGPLQVFTLEIQRNTELFRVVMGIDQFSPANALSQPIIGFVDEFIEVHWLRFSRVQLSHTNRAARSGQMAKRIVCVLATWIFAVTFTPSYQQEDSWKRSIIGL
jgi:hypothetical protein